MSKREIYEAKVEALVLPIVEANQFELVDVEYVKEAVHCLRLWIKMIQLKMRIFWKLVPLVLEDQSKRTKISREI